MSKYIDVDKLITEIERQMNECIGRFGVIHKLPEYRCLKNIHSYIDSLQQEQPSLPSNLDEAAREYAKDNTWCDEFTHDSEYQEWEEHTAEVFKAGAKWMAEQEAKKEE